MACHSLDRSCREWPPGVANAAFEELLDEIQGQDAASLVLATDGSVTHDPPRCGWGCYIRHGESTHCVSGACRLTLSSMKRIEKDRIFKKGSKKLPSNYRAVSLLPLLGKVLERVIYNNLLQHVKPALTHAQHGFLPQRSCETNLATLLKTAWESISDSSQTDIIYTDYSAAFQSVNHSLLLHKLRHSYHVSGTALNWLSTYLKNRKQRVVVNGRCSDWTDVVSGTPEGGLLSPLLFAMYVNDLPDKIKTNCLLFADDVKLYHKISTSDDSLLLQKDIDSLCQWSADWNLNLNPAKCKSFTVTLKRSPISSRYSINGSTLERVSSIRDLGVWLDTKLTFRDHVNHSVAKANRALGVMIRSLQTGCARGALKPEPILAAYFGNVRSILEYGCVIWGGAAKTHLDRLDHVQHKFLIWFESHVYTTHPSPSLSYSDLLQSFNIASLAQRRVQYDILFVYKILSGRIDSSLLLQSFSLQTPTRHTRSALHTVMHVPFARVDTVKRAVFARAPRNTNLFLSARPAMDLFNSALGTMRKQVISYVKNMTI